MSDLSASQELPAGHRVGRYTVVRTLGRGGMGVVYVARDERLERDVALKMIGAVSDEMAVTRFWREARAAASINHPNVCQLFEVDESAGRIYLAMELLDGEPLDARLARGALPPVEAVRIATDMLAALGALHARGFVHRDVKPSNVFLTIHGAKLLDFGLARTLTPDTVRLDATPRDDVTAAGIIVGTPRYMAPEQVAGDTVDGRADLYATGAVLFEMLAGRPPFVGDNMLDLLYATLNEQPPALHGPPAVIAIDRVIRRAMVKDPAGRYADASQMAAGLRDVALADVATGAIVPVRALTRLVVPPIRLAQPDQDIAFLAFGLAEAISGSVAALGDLVVRSPSVAAEWAESGADPRRLAASADVDLVLAGSLLRSGSRLRATVQLLDATSGTVLGAETVNGSLDDIFALEDALTRAVVALVGRRPGAAGSATTALERRDVPANGRAFELYLRGNDAMRTLATHYADARGLFEDAVRADPGFAPAWAMLGRCHRFIGKFVEDRDVNTRKAEDAFRRALALSPDLPAAHRFYTSLEADSGRAESAIARLLQQARVSRNDPHIFAGLVHACRYAGLADESLAAHDEARRLDPHIDTSVSYTIAQLPDDRRNTPLPAVDAVNPATYADLIIRLIRHNASGLREAVDVANRSELPHSLRGSFDALSAVAFGTRSEALALITKGVAAYDDPEAIFLFALMCAHLAEPGIGVPLVADIVGRGYVPVAMLESDPLFAPFREDTRFEPILADARMRAATARMVFERGGGPQLLGL